MYDDIGQLREESILFEGGRTTLTHLLIVQFLASTHLATECPIQCLVIIKCMLLGELGNRTGCLMDALDAGDIQSVVEEMSRSSISISKSANRTPYSTFVPRFPPSSHSSRTCQLLLQTSDHPYSSPDEDINLIRLLNLSISKLKFNDRNLQTLADDPTTDVPHDFHKQWDSINSN